MSRVNLLPGELRQRAATRRLTSIVVAAGLGIIALIGLFYFTQTQRLADAQDDLAVQEERNAGLRTQIQELQSFADLQAELAAKQGLVAGLFVNEVSWSSALLDVSRVIPDASFLTNLAGQVQSAAAETDPTVPAVGELIGTITFQGVARETETIATWLVRLEQVEGWVNAWVTNAQESAPFSRVYTFSSGLDLTIEAATERAQEVPAP
ncbi:MAG: PilN domain-containing protein [Actinomycetota bacterium]